MKEIKISEQLNKGLLYVYHGITILAIITLILYLLMYAVQPTREIGIALSSVFCMNGLLFCGWMLHKYWDQVTKNDYITDRYLWLGISCGLLYVCLQILDSGLWLWIPSILFIWFFVLFARDEVRTILNWKKGVRITW